MKLYVIIGTPADKSILIVFPVNKAHPTAELSNPSYPSYTPTHPINPRLIQQVDDLFIIQLHELSGDFEVGGRLTGAAGGLLSLGDPSEEVVHRPRDDTGGLGTGVHLEPRAHRVRLAGARLREGAMSGGRYGSSYYGVYFIYTY